MKLKDYLLESGDINYIDITVKVLDKTWKFSANVFKTEDGDFYKEPDFNIDILGDIDLEDLKSITNGTDTWNCKYAYAEITRDTLLNKKDTELSKLILTKVNADLEESYKEVKKEYKKKINSWYFYGVGYSLVVYTFILIAVTLAANHNGMGDKEKLIFLCVVSLVFGADVLSAVIKGIKENKRWRLRNKEKLEKYAEALNINEQGVV